MSRSHLSANERNELIKITQSNIFFDNRITTFKNWPYKNGTCTAYNMAEAGFYQISKCCAKCAFCGKEMDGWEEEDIPMMEHKKHSGQCPFLEYKKAHNGHEMKLKDAISLSFQSLLFNQKKMLREHRVQIA